MAQRRQRLSLVSVLLCLLPGIVSAADWPMYRADAERGGHTAEPLASELLALWVYQPAHAPHVAWRRRERLRFDRAYQPIVADGLLFFGSSADGHVYALDAENGDLRWRFVTGAPIRFAPAVADGRLFVGSDDGYLYALSTDSGKVLWQRRAGPNDEMVLGNERLVSRWVVRGGPAVRDGIVYFAAGIWPTEGIFIYALRAATGEVVWLNAAAGRMYMPQPHGGANAESGVSAQGYLVVTEDKVLLSTGRSVPAAFDRQDGKFLYYHLQKHGRYGGSQTMAAREFFFNGGLALSAATGEIVENLGPGPMAGLPDASGIVHATAENLIAYKWVQKERLDRKGQTIVYTGLDRAVELSTGEPSLSAIVAGAQVVLGGHGSVSVLNINSQERVWTAEVDGNAYALAAAGGRLYVGTDSGAIHCFGAGRGESGRRIVTPRSERPYGANELYARAAREILQRSGIETGYCVDLGCGDGALVYELATRSDLFVYGVDPDPNNVRSARAKLRAAGLYGTRAVVHQRLPSETNYPKYFADLIVSAQTIGDGVGALPAAEATRLQRPYGGTVCVGRPQRMHTDVRGALAGVGRWTHQYADPANTVCSDDPVKGPLRPLWFREVNQDLPQRHGRGPAPLFSEGRLFSEGIDTLVAVDAYNGRVIWEYPLYGILSAYDGDELMGTSGTHSNYCVTPQGVFVRREGTCLRIDSVSGKLLGEFKIPAADGGQQPDTWGYIASEQGLLFGTAANPEHVVTARYVQSTGDMKKQLTESTLFFVLDAENGALKWKYEAHHSIRHNAIAIGGGRVFLIDRPLAKFDRFRRRPKDAASHEKGVLKAFSATTGELQWETSDDIYGTLLALSVQHDALLMSYQPTRFQLSSEAGGRMTVLRSSTGRRLWEKAVEYDSRPTLNDRTIFAQGGAWDLLTGDDRTFNFDRSYGCGILAAGRSMMVFRSATLGYYDLEQNEKTENFGGMRPGCWINAIPAGGLVLVPDGSSGCSCAYQNKTWIALEGRD